MSNTNVNYTNYINNPNSNTVFTNQNSSVYSNQNPSMNYSSNANSNSYFNSYTGSSQAQARSLWIGEIDTWMDEGFMIKIFQEISNVKNLKIIRDKAKGTSLGYGFVEFESQEIAKDVLNALNGKVIPETNKTLKLNWASYSAGKQAMMNSNQGIIDYSIYVGDLDLSVTEEILKDFFSKYYTSVIGVKVIIDPINKNSKGYGFVKFSEQSEASRALTEMNGKIINGKAIRTNQASFKKITAESNLGTPLLNHSGNISNTQSPYTPYNNNPNNYLSDTYSFSHNTNNNNYLEYLPNISTSMPVKSKIPYHSSNSVTNNRNINTVSDNYNETNNKNNLNLMNLNNFYIHNPNADHTLDVYSAGSNYNLNNFYYNNYNSYKGKMNNNGNKTGINNATNANVNNYNTNYFNYMNNVSSQVRPQQQQQGINNNVTNPYPFMYNHGNYNNINTNDPNKISNNNSNINNVAGNATTSGPNINTDEKTNNQ